ncbi:MAG: hypothetical protein LAT62_00380 [Natronospirillum sp.]|uniref:hypothetical protein n=1 Tax=Natronospirillum sp. TaxID=2812955 RepID=UPI0025F05B6A|nr:hypothetical protein [Natronospirillum sp.]MCH8550357.1 hypothetical protein [Natronospirillum sp.]
MPLSPQSLDWVATEQIIRQVPCTCVDGRTAGHRFSAVGGSLGVILAVLNEYQVQSDRMLSDAAVSEALTLFADRIGPVYLHSDTHAMNAIIARMGLPSETTPGSLSQSQQRSFIELASQADYQGCGHLRLLLTQSSAYAMSAALVESALRVVLRLWFAGQAGVVFDILQGDHAESGVVVIDRQTSRPLNETTPLTDAPDQFFCHRPLKHELIRRFVAELQQCGWTTFSSESAERIASDHDKAADLTLSVLAAQLPVEHLTL